MGTVAGAVGAGLASSAGAGAVGSAAAGAATAGLANEALSDDPDTPSRPGAPGQGGQQQRAAVGDVGVSGVTPGSRLVRRRRLNDDGTVDIVFERTFTENKRQEIQRRQQLMNEIIKDILRDSTQGAQAAQAPIAQPEQQQTPTQPQNLSQLAQQRGQTLVSPVGQG